MIGGLIVNSAPARRGSASARWDPDISRAAAFYQVSRVAADRHLGEDAAGNLVAVHVTPRQFGLLGEPRVNVLELNLDLDKVAPTGSK